MKLVGGPMAEADRVLHRLLGGGGSALEHVAAYLADAGGKRLRPALTALGARALGMEADEDVVTLMACGELIHLGSLLHDDVVDEGDVRRGQPSAHRLHGNAVSILSGDLCVGRALAAALSAGGLLAGRVLSETVAEMSEGEVLQLQRAGRLDTDRATYLDVIDRKSASLIAWCVSSPALARGLSVEAEALAAYGRGVGRAYQITDDVLDYADRTGKPPGADLRERKVTLPLLYAMARMPGLRARLEARAPTEEEIQDMVIGVRASGALEAALQDAGTFVDEALGALEALPDNPGREALRVLGRFVVERSS